MTELPHLIRTITPGSELEFGQWEVSITQAEYDALDEYADMAAEMSRRCVGEYELREVQVMNVRDTGGGNLVLTIMADGDDARDLAVEWDDEEGSDEDEDSDEDDA